MQHNSFNRSKQCNPKEVVVINVKYEDRQMSNINRWVVSSWLSDLGFPYWQGRIFCDKNEEGQKEVVKRIYDIAYDEELYRIIRKEDSSKDPEVLFGLTRLDFHPVKKKGRFYDTYKISKNQLRDEIDENGLSLLDDYEEQCKLSYYNLDGQIVTEWIGRFSTLHVDLRSENYMYLDRQGILLDDCFYMPVTIKYDYNNGCQDFTISLHSDIWFPRVVGWLDSEEPFYDNSELAALNTPRLNRFLQRTKELILSLGGEWELVGEKPVPVDKYDESDMHESYYPYGMNPRRIIPTKAVCIDGAQKKVYPSLSDYIGVENISPECQLSENGISLEINTKSRNRWCMLTHEKSENNYPVWNADFPPGIIATKQDFWQFLKTILEVGKQEEIFQIFAEEAEFHQFIHDVDSGILPVPSLEELFSGVDYVERAEELMANNLPKYIHNIQTMTKISYYEKDGQVIDKHVGKEDLGKFLYNYHLGTLGRSQYEYGKTFLHPYYGCFRFYESYYPPEESYVRVILDSDIWFPVIEGYSERKVGLGAIGVELAADEKAYYQGGFDNRELANRHTPRLNRFLSAIAAKVIEMGGEWSIGEDVDPKYKEQMTLTGIKLDI
jgi:hypothetical protein